MLDFYKKYDWFCNLLTILFILLLFLVPISFFISYFNCPYFDINASVIGVGFSGITLEYFDEYGVKSTLSFEVENSSEYNIGDIVIIRFYTYHDFFFKREPKLIGIQ